MNAYNADLNDDHLHSQLILHVGPGTPKYSPQMTELLWMMTYARPAGSEAEEEFIDRFIRPLAADNHYDTDALGNIAVMVPCADGSDIGILWSSHTDTVHRSGGRSRILVDDQYIHTVSDDCLGADCTTGVWLMINMIRERVPGLYVFHRMEECGGIGSEAIAKDYPELLKGIKAAIAFDRYGTTSVITHQFRQRCASDEWSNKLADRLNDTGLFTQPFIKDDGGTFTDTANYTHLVPECTNISVGYYHQHTKNEKQDWQFALSLLAALINLDLTDLTTTFRDPNVVEDLDVVSWTKHYKEWDEAVYNAAVAKDGQSITSYNLYDLVYNYPGEVADALASYGVTFSDLKRDLEDRGVEVA